MITPAKKMRRAIKALPTQQRFLRAYHADVRKLKKWCEENEIVLYDFDSASAHFICVLSQNEYSLHERRRDLEQNAESYFLNEEDYDKWCEEYAQKSNIGHNMVHNLMFIGVIDCMDDNKNDKMRTTNSSTVYSIGNKCNNYHSVHILLGRYI